MSEQKGISRSRMDSGEIRSRRSELRREIKERMQRELDRRKKEIKKRVQDEQIPVQEKRRKYRSEVKQEKLLLMSLAKEEFRARKRMLGISLYEEKEPFSEPPPIPVEALEGLKPEPPADESVLQHFPDAVKPAAFIYEDKEDSDLRELATPINASDAVPLGMAEAAIDAGIGVPKKQQVLKEEEHGLYYYVINLIIHPIQTMDEFDDYLSTESGVAKVILFYLISLVPIILFIMLGEEIISKMPRGMLWSSIGAAAASEGNFIPALTSPIIELLFYSFTVAIANYFIADEANFLTLATYFAFVEAVTRIIIYSFIILIVFAAVMAAIAPQVLIVVALLFLAFLIWSLCLNIVVLMTAYGYDWFSASFLSLIASALRIVAGNMLLNRLMSFLGYN